MEAEWRILVCGFDAVGMEGKMRKVLSKEEEDNVGGRNVAHPLNDKNWWGELRTNHTADDCG
jgi:hypothetical protein